MYQIPPVHPICISFTRKLSFTPNRSISKPLYPRTLRIEASHFTQHFLCISQDYLSIVYAHPTMTSTLHPHQPQRPSFLHISTQPSLHSKTFAPSPVTPHSFHDTHTHTTLPPQLPSAWIWTCHKCRATYRLGTTRRCLNDGHLFCAGGTCMNQRTGHVRKHKACSSTFDYAGWRAWATWRGSGEDEALAGADDCARNCAYPSECRWSRRWSFAAQSDESIQARTSLPAPLRPRRKSTSSYARSTAPSPVAGDRAL